MHSACYKDGLLLFLHVRRSRAREMATIHLHRNVNYKGSRGTVEARRNMSRISYYVLVKIEEGSVDTNS
jgi:hypothetical protein